MERRVTRQMIEKTIEEFADEVFNVVCEKLCKWPELAKDQEHLFETHCKDCPLKELL